ncbi:hypothetical protein ES703_36764 [subsurface metagenome]
MDVRELRRKLGISRDALARELGMSYHTVSLWERGKTKPSPLALEKLEKLQAGIARGNQGAAGGF